MDAGFGAGNGPVADAGPVFKICSLNIGDAVPIPTLPAGTKKLPLNDVPDTFDNLLPANTLTLADNVWLFDTKDAAKVLTLADKEILLALAAANVAANTLTLADKEILLALAAANVAAKVLTFADKDIAFVFAAI